MSKLKRESRDIIYKPLITEKNSENAAYNKYVFEVSPFANKIEIRDAVEDIFKVKVLKVNTIASPGKPRRFGKYMGKTSSTRKAVVTLKQGDKIEVGGVSMFEH